MKRRSGLTLIEAMLASTLLIVTVFSFTNGFRLGLNTAKRLRDQVVLDGAVRGLLAQLDLDGFGASGRRGTLAPERPDVSFELELSQGEVPTYRNVKLTLRGAVPGGEVVYTTGIADRRARKRAVQVNLQ